MENQKLQTVQNSNKLLQKLDATELKDDLKRSLAIVMERTDMEFKSIDATIEDIITEFSDLPIEQVREALRNGSLGEYGSTFRLSTQEICVWIRKYRFNKNSKRIS